jgi:hypothetical protein
MKWIAVFFTVIAVATTAGPSFAYPQINTISSVMVSTSPLLFKTTFTVQLVGYEPFGYDGFKVITGTGPTVTLTDCESPTPWSCHIATTVPTGAAYFIPPTGYPWPWPGIVTFSITSDQAAPCVEIRFQNGLLSKTPRTNSDFIVVGCLVVDAPLPTHSSTWGALKAVYR